MATLISVADGNVSDAVTVWDGVDAGSGATQQTRSGSTNTTTSYVYSSAFTDTNLNVMNGILLYCNRVNTTGTVTVAYSQDNGTTDTRNLTVNASDLPVDPSWVFFKFASTLTLDGGADNKVGIKSSSAGNATFFRDATAGNWSRLVRVASLATAAAGDVLYIVGEITAAGSTTTRTITLTDTASTDYGTGVAGAADNGIEIGNAGVLTFGTAAATNYTLKCSGTINVWGAGTLSIGTTGTPIPRGSTATLTLDCGANIDFGLIINAGGAFNSQALSRTSAKNIYYAKLNSDAAANATSLSVDTDTGWLDNDVIAVASTTRTATQCESGTLNGAAGASSLTVDGFAGTGGGVLNAHSGTAPTQAEVILLTRSILIQGASSSLQGYVVFGTTATVDVDWTEFKWMGSLNSGKRGIDIQTTTGTCSIMYSSVHDFVVSSSNGINITAQSGTGITFSNSVIYNINSIFFFTQNASSGSWIADSNIFMLNVANANGVSLSDIGGTFTNNIIAGSTGTGFSFTEGSSSTFGTISNITVHSCAGAGISSGNSNLNGTLSNLTVWRNNGGGISWSNQSLEITFDTVTVFGNSSINISLSGGGRYTFLSPTVNGDTTFSTATGINTVSSGECDIYIFSGDFGTASGIKTSHSTSDIGISASVSRIILNNTKLSSSTELTGQTSLSPNGFISSQKHDQTSGLHKTWKKYGTIAIETTTVHTGSQSFKMTPNNASNKLVSGSFYIPVTSGLALTPTVYVYEDASYNGARSRLILKRNDAIGVTADAVIDTATAASDAAWEGLTGTTATATDDGVMEFVIDCDGTAGNLFVDSFTVA